jgi:hypothetical protein
LNEFISISGLQDVELKFDVDAAADDNFHTKASFEFNKFACEFNATIAGKDTDLGKEFLDYACEFNGTAPAATAANATDVAEGQKKDGDGEGSDGATFRQSDGSRTPPTQTKPAANASLETVPFSQSMPASTGSQLSTLKEEDESSRSHSPMDKLNLSQQGEGYQSADLDEDTHGGGLDLEHSFVKKVGGQRVDREKFSIDETKSFVKTGGYPSSKVK